MRPNLPPGQRRIEGFPRFGLTRFAARFPENPNAVKLEVGGEVESALDLSAALRELPRVEQVSDFHCVTTWTATSLRWGGWRYADFHERVAVPRARPGPSARFVVLKAADGGRTILPLEHLLAEDVLLADTLNGEPLTVAHGAPLRLVAPAHYGYKSLKHLCRVEYWSDDSHWRPAAFRFMDHLDARVAREERGRGAPGWLLRFLYRPLVKPTIALFARELARHTR